MGTPWPTFGPPKLAKSREIEEIAPRMPLTLQRRKPQNRAPLLTNLGGKSKGKTTKGSSIHPPSNPKEKRPRTHHKKIAKKGLRKSLKRRNGKTHPSLEEPH
jgi:hypothetical protein